MCTDSRGAGTVQLPRNEYDALTSHPPRGRVSQPSAREPARHGVVPELIVVERGADHLDVLGVPHDAERAHRLGPHPGQVVGRQGRGPVCAAGDLVSRGHLQTGLGRTPVLVAESRHDRLGGAVVPDVQQAACSPGAGPVRRPHRLVEDGRAGPHLVAGEVAQLLQMGSTRCPAHQLGAHGHERGDPEVSRELDDEPGDRSLRVAGRWQPGHTPMMRVPPTDRAGASVRP